VVSACGGRSPATLATRTPPDLAAFLRLPVATPTACPATVSGTTSGRRSPWVGHVDVSVFLVPSATPADLRRVRRTLDALPPVRDVYFESKRKAYAEFQRLYTCSAQVPRRSVPASYRLVLTTVTQPERDDLVRTIRALRGVGSVSCDPSNPCVVDTVPDGGR
jgi:cell division protein FtsX